MKKYFIIVMVLIASIAFVSCTGEAGDDGAAGPSGVSIVRVDFQNGMFPGLDYVGCDETRLSYENPTTNYSTYSYLGIGNVAGSTDIYRSVIKFDLSYIVPSNVIVQEAYLTLYFDAVDNDGYTTTTAYAVNSSWIKAQTTWNERQTSTTWSTLGGDYDATPVSDSKYISTTTAGDSVTFTLNKTLVQEWLNGTTVNNGLILKGTNETTGSNWIRPCSSLDTDIEERPKLTIKYTLP